MRADQLKKLAGKPVDVSMPIELKPIQSRTDRNSLVDAHLSNVVAYLEQNGYNPHTDYIAKPRNKRLKEIADAKAEYKKRLAKVITEVNETGAERIRQRSHLVVDGNPLRKWSKPHTYVDKDKGIRIQTSPNELFADIFAGIYATFDNNPCTNPKAFDRELFEKWNRREFSRRIFNSHGEGHTFKVELVWRP